MHDSGMSCPGGSDAPNLGCEKSRPERFFFSVRFSTSLRKASEAGLMLPLARLVVDAVLRQEGFPVLGYKQHGVQDIFRLFE